MVNLAVLACVLRVTAKKRSSTFSRIKCAPRENPGYAHVPGTSFFLTSSPGVGISKLIITCSCKLQVNSDAPLPEPTTGLVELTDDKLLSLKVHDLNKYLQSLPPEERRLLKQRRRTLKNRAYSQTCRSRRESNHAAEVSRLRERVRIVTAERDYYRGKYECLQAYVDGVQSDGIVFNC